MKISKRQLKKIIREEKLALLSESQRLSVSPELIDYGEFIKLAVTDRSAAINWLKQSSQLSSISDEEYDQIVGITLTRLRSMLRDLEYFLGI